MQIVFFDGVCVLCNHFARFLIKQDTQHKLYFSPLQGKTITRTPAASFAQENSLVFCTESKVYLRSDAAILSIAALGGGWKLMKLFLLIPRCIRDVIYRFIATHRYKWFGKQDYCSIDSGLAKEYFLN